MHSLEVERRVISPPTPTYARHYLAHINVESVENMEPYIVYKSMEF